MNLNVFRFRILRSSILPFLVLPPILFASAAGALTVTVKQGSAPAGFTEWTFTGSSTYTQLNPGGTFAVVPPLAAIVEWKGNLLSDYVKTGTYDNYTPTLASGLISLTVTPVSGPARSGTITALHIDHDASGDDFGIGLDGLSTSPLNTAIPLSSNDVVSWSGSGIFPVDFTNLNVGSFLFNNYGDSTLSRFGDLPITITVQEAPAPLPVLGCGVALSFSRKLRKRVLALHK
jgi:hypothetical protein